MLNIINVAGADGAKLVVAVFSSPPDTPMGCREIIRLLIIKD